MKKISLLLLVSASSLFLTGCWKRKKSHEEKQKSGIFIQSNQGLEKIVVVPAHEHVQEIKAIDYVDSSAEYKICESKTIFADDETNEVVAVTEIETKPDIFLDQLNDRSRVIKSDKDEVLLIQHKQKEYVGVVYFNFDVSGEIKEKSKDTMKLIINKLNELKAVYPQMEVIVEGHACNSCGSERYNLVLSDDRAKTVKSSILEGTTISADKIFETGYGTSHMIVSGNRQEQAPNRRCEIFVVLN